MKWKRADPMQQLWLVGRPVHVHPDAAMHEVNETGKNLVPHNNTDVMIDRFDGRASLDYVQEYKGGSPFVRTVSDGGNSLELLKRHREQQTEVLLNFERYLPLIAAYRRGEPEKEHVLRMHEFLSAKLTHMTDSLKDVDMTHDSAHGALNEDDGDSDDDMIFDDRMLANKSGESAGSTSSQDVDDYARHAFRISYFSSIYAVAVANERMTKVWRQCRSHVVVIFHVFIQIYVCSCMVVLCRNI